MDIRKFFKATPKKGEEKKKKGAKQSKLTQWMGKRKNSSEPERPKKKRKLAENKEATDQMDIDDQIKNVNIESKSISSPEPKPKKTPEKAPEKATEPEEIEDTYIPPENAETKETVAGSDTEDEEEVEGKQETDDVNAHYDIYRKKKDRGKGFSYHPINDAAWKKTDKNIPYAALSDVFDAIGAKSGRLDKIVILSNFFRSVFVLHPQELHIVAYLCSNQLAAPYENIELGVGDGVIYRALRDSTGRKVSEMKEQMAKIGDLGIVAMKSRQKQKTLFKPKPLTVEKVYSQLRKIALLRGTKSGKAKDGLINKLFVASKGVEAKYITRHCLGKSMKLGLAEQTVFASLARACTITPPGLDDPIMDLSKKMSTEEFDAKQKEYTELVKQVFSELPNYDVVLKALVEHGLPFLHDHCHLTPGIPVKAMLAKPTTGVQEILERFKDCKFTLEYKYDGERAQIHLLPDGSIKIFSRNAENNTTKYPDLVAAVPSFCKDDTKSFIIDCEVVAYDRETNKIRPFQDLAHRKRKDVKEGDVTIQVCLYTFDLIYLNGNSLLKTKLEERRTLLQNGFNRVEGQFHFADYKDSSDPEEIQAFLDLAVEQSCEGLMVKALDGDATYEPSKRSMNWLKCKKDYLEGCGDTLDLVVLGAFHGTGKRTGFYGSYLVGCYNDQEDTYQSTCKVGTGFKDEDLKTLTEFLKKHLTEKKPMEYEVDSTFDCDVWFKPCQVWEVKCADLQVSPVHTAAIGQAHEEKGIGLRFPRFLRVRDDKKTEDATTADQIYDMYSNQAVVQKNKKRF